MYLAKQCEHCHANLDHADNKPFRAIIPPEHLGEVQRLCCGDCPTDVLADD